MSELTITMRQIADAKPCDDNWKDAPLKALGKTEIDDTPVTFHQIVETSGLDDALWVLRCLPDCERWRVKLLARSFALHVVHLWDAPPIVEEWLRTDDEKIRDTALAAALDARAELAAEASARAAAQAAAGDTWAAEAAAWAAVGAAGDAERTWQTQELLRVMSLDYSPEVMLLKMPEGAK